MPDHAFLIRLKKMKSLHSLGLLVGLASLLALPAQAIVKPNGLFSDGAVLQQGQKIPVFGTADEGEAVTVKFGKQTVSTTAQGGRWRVDLRPVLAGGPYTLTIRRAEQYGHAERHFRWRGLPVQRPVQHELHAERGCQRPAGHCGRQ